VTNIQFFQTNAQRKNTAISHLDISDIMKYCTANCNAVNVSRYINTGIVFIWL